MFLKVFRWVDFTPAGLISFIQLLTLKKTFAEYDNRPNSNCKSLHTH